MGICDFLFFLLEGVENVDKVFVKVVGLIEDRKIGKLRSLFLSII
jgi:hypothetical protein